MGSKQNQSSALTNLVLNLFQDPRYLSQAQIARELNTNDATVCTTIKNARDRGDIRATRPPRPKALPRHPSDLRGRKAVPFTALENAVLDAYYRTGHYQSLSYIATVVSTPECPVDRIKVQTILNKGRNRQDPRAAPHSSRGAKPGRRVPRNVQHQQRHAEAPRVTREKSRQVLEDEILPTTFFDRFTAQENETLDAYSVGKTVMQIATDRGEPLMDIARIIRRARLIYDPRAAHPV